MQTHLCPSSWARALLKTWCDLTPMSQHPPSSLPPLLRTKPPQFAIGSAILSNTPAHHSHMAHSLDTLAAANYVPGNSYRCGSARGLTNELHVLRYAHGGPWPDDRRVALQPALILMHAIAPNAVSTPATTIP